MDIEAKEKAGERFRIVLFVLVILFALLYFVLDISFDIYDVLENLVQYWYLVIPVVVYVLPRKKKSRKSLSDRIEEIKKQVKY